MGRPESEFCGKGAGVGAVHGEEGAPAASAAVGVDAGPSAGAGRLASAPGS